MSGRLLLALIALGSCLILPPRADADDDLRFEVSMVEQKLGVITFKAWVTNDTDRAIRIPANLEYFIRPVVRDSSGAFVTIGLATQIPSKPIESVDLLPGHFYGCVLTGLLLGKGHWDVRYELHVHESKENPGLWVGGLKSNQFTVTVD